MNLLILGADNSEEMENLAEELSQKKFKVRESGDEFILMRRMRVGNILIHAISLILALFVSAIFIFINVGYFTYSYLWASPHVLITTEKVDDEGNPLEFNDMNEVLDKATAIL